jgi:hypothetical protein
MCERSGVERFVHGMAFDSSSNVLQFKRALYYSTVSFFTDRTIHPHIIL